MLGKGCNSANDAKFKKRLQLIVLPGAKHAQYAKTEQIKLSFHFSSLALIYHEVLRKSVPAEVETEADIPI